MNKEKKSFNALLFLLPIFAVIVAVIIVLFIRKAPEKNIEVTGPSLIYSKSDEGLAGGTYSPIFTAGEQIPVSEEELSIFSDDCDGYFMKMHNLSEFDPNYIGFYSGLNILTTRGAFLSLSAFSEAFELIWASPDRQVNNIYLEIDPLSLWESSGETDNERTENLNRFLEYFSKHPETNFCIIYSFPHIDYWVFKTVDEYEYIQSIYQLLTDSFSEHPNISIAAPGNLEWLVSNSNNYLSMFSTNSDVSYKLVSYCLFTDRVSLDSSKVPSWFEDIRRISLNYRKGDYTVYLSTKAPIVFFGDSIMDYYRVSYGIPSLVSSITGNEVYNLAKGGMSLASHESEENACCSFETLVSSVVSGNLYEGYLTSGMKNDYYRFKTNVSNNDKVIFVIVLGINDYVNSFSSNDSSDKLNVNTTYGGMVTGINRLKKAYPNSEIFVVAPYRLSEEYNATVDGEFDVENKMFCSYIAAIEYGAMDTNSHHLSLFGKSPISGDSFGIYLEDGIHPTEQGELVLAQIISSFLAEELNR